MKPGQAASRRKRVLLIYTLIMLIPGIILGYLASRGILNDKALREKQARQELSQRSEVFFSSLDSLLNQLVFSPDIRIQDSDHLLLQLDKLPLEEKQIVAANLLYYPKGYIRAMSNSIPPEFETGWRYEFLEQDLTRAKQFYSEFLDHPNQATQVAAQFALVRILLKLEQKDQAIKILGDLVKSQEDLYFQGFPARSLALFELIKLNSNDPTMLADYRQQLIFELMHPKMPYEKAQFRFLTGILHHDNLAKLTLATQKTEQSIQLFEEAELLFRSSVRNPNKRYYLQDQFGLAFISYTHPDGKQTAAIIDLKPFIESKLDTLLRWSALDQVHWLISDEGGSSLWGSDSATAEDWLTFSFPETLPDWKLMLAMQHRSWLSTMLEPGNGVFLLIFIFIILVMMFGLIFTLNILNQEFKLNKLKTEFISNVSHELKSPLTSIRQMTEMLNDQRIDSEEQRNDYYGIMLDQSEHLSHLIDNILDFSRMEENRKVYKFEEIDLVPLVEKVIRNFRNQLEEQGFQVTMEVRIKEAIILADRGAIKQVLYNLIDNAVKFSLDEKRIDIILEDLRPMTQDPNQTKDGRNKKEVLLTIRDFGIGISAKDLDKIFERFYRGAETSKLAIKGSGIGLTLVKLMVEAHGGRIEVESEAGKGSTFRIFIPLIEDTNEEDVVS